MSNVSSALQGRFRRALALGVRINCRPVFRHGNPLLSQSSSASEFRFLR